jgi:hypothetical protein
MHCPIYDEHVFGLAELQVASYSFNTYNIRPKIKIWPEQINFNFQIQVVKINVKIW